MSIILSVILLQQSAPPQMVNHTRTNAARHFSRVFCAPSHSVSPFRSLACVKQEPTQCFKSEGRDFLRLVKQEKATDSGRRKWLRKEHKSTKKIRVYMTSGMFEQRRREGDCRGTYLHQCTYWGSTLSHDWILKGCGEKKPLQKLRQSGGDGKKTERPCVKTRAICLPCQWWKENKPSVDLTGLE